jgi:hypothetical protein
MNDSASIPKPLIPDLQRAEEFIAGLPGPTMVIVMPPDGGGPFPCPLREALKRNASGIVSAYFQLNEVRADFNGKKPGKADIVIVRAIVVDIEWDRNKFAGRFEEGLADVWNRVCAKLRKIVEQPTLIIYTGGGFQLIWLIEPLSNTSEVQERAEAVGKALAAYFGGDPVEDVSRMLRLPGSINYPKKDKRDKGQPARVANWMELSGKIYMLEELETAHWMQQAGKAVSSKSNPKGKSQPTNDNLNDDLNADLSGGMRELNAGEDLFVCKEIGPLIAAVPNGPFSVRGGWVNPLTGEPTSFGWLNWLLVMRGIADDDPSLEDQCEQLFDEVC